ncbi:IS110 family transposase [Streptomyces sp. NPDC001984]
MPRAWLVPEAGVSTVDLLPCRPEEPRPMILLGVDPHKSTHTATAVDPTANRPISTIRIEATLADYRRLLAWSRKRPEHRWAVEGAAGLGRHLAQWLVARGETVVDVHASANARARQLSRGGGRKNDTIAWRCSRTAGCGRRRRGSGGSARRSWEGPGGSRSARCPRMRSRRRRRRPRRR